MTAPEPNPLAEFAAKLIDLRIRAGNPSLRRLEELSGGKLPRATTSEKLRGHSLVEWPFVEVYIQACAAHAHDRERTLDGLDDRGYWVKQHVAMLTAAARNRSSDRLSDAARAQLAELSASDALQPRQPPSNETTPPTEPGELVEPGDLPDDAGDASVPALVSESGPVSEPSASGSVADRTTATGRKGRLARTRTLIWIASGIAAALVAAAIVVAFVPRPLGRGAAGNEQVDPLHAYEGSIIRGPDGRRFWVKNKQRLNISNDVMFNCIKVRAHAGDPVDVPAAVAGAPPDGLDAYCPYETERGLNFVQEDGQQAVWLVGIDDNGKAFKRLVRRFCVGDPYRTPLKHYRVGTVPPGETTGRYQGPDFWGDAGPTCDNLPKPQSG